MAIWPFNRKKKSLGHVGGHNHGLGSIVREPFTGAWQQNKELRPSSVRQFFAIYSCLTLISADISKMAASVKRKDSNGIWQKIDGAINKLLKKPNRYQNSVQFRQWWATSKLSCGNTYALKQRGAGNSIDALYILNPEAVTPLIADDGSVYYQLSTNELAGIGSDLVVPASEIIHDRYQPQFHPLIGVSPIYAAALAGALGKKNSRR